MAISMFSYACWRFSITLNETIAHLVVFVRTRPTEILFRLRRKNQDELHANTMDSGKLHWTQSFVRCEIVGNSFFCAFSPLEPGTAQRSSHWMRTIWVKCCAKMCTICVHSDRHFNKMFHVSFQCRFLHFSAACSRWTSTMHRFLLPNLCIRFRCDVPRSHGNCTKCTDKMSGKNFLRARAMVQKLLYDYYNPDFLREQRTKNASTEKLNNSSRNRAASQAHFYCSIIACASQCARICAICAAFHFACRLWSHWLAMFRAILQLVPFGLMLAGSPAHSFNDRRIVHGMWYSLCERHLFVMAN